MMKFKKIYIEITNICNLDCPFCSKDTKEKRSMTTEELLSFYNTKRRL